MKRTATSLLVFALATAAAFSPAACGGGVAQERSDGSPVITPVAEGGLIDGTTTGPVDGGVIEYDVSLGPNGEGGYAGDDAGGGVQVDAGYYYGDGSFWVEGGAYPEPDAAEPGGLDADTVDAAPGCGPLAACCASLSGATQSLCSAVVGLGSATNCSAELTQLQGEGYCTGVSILATQVQVPANRMVSDGTLLFWTTSGTPGLLAMPATGGAITVLLSGPVGFVNPSPYGRSYFLAVDDINVYVTQGSSFLRLPRNGAAPTLINGSGADVIAATALGTTAYWLENAGQQSMGEALAFRSAPLLGGPISTIAAFDFGGGPTYMAVTSGTVFFGYQVQQLLDFPTTGVPSGGPPTLAAGMDCEFLTSDADAIYCAQQSGSNLRIASDGSTTALGSAVSTSTIVFDDTYVYWADMTTVGTIMKAPKTGGGSAVVIATDTSPTAIAVDANSVYWSDQEGYIKSVPK